MCYQIHWRCERERFLDGTSLNEEAPVSCVEERKRRARNPRTEEIMIRSKNGSKRSNTREEKNEGLKEPRCASCGA